MGASICTPALGTTSRPYYETSPRQYHDTTRRHFRDTTRRHFHDTTRRQYRDTTRRHFRDTTRRPYYHSTGRPYYYTTRGPCRQNQFKCELSGRCISLEWVCDGDYDCARHQRGGDYDYSDERRCNQTATTTKRPQPRPTSDHGRRFVRRNELNYYVQKMTYVLRGIYHGLRGTADDINRRLRN